MEPAAAIQSLVRKGFARFENAVAPTCMEACELPLPLLAVTSLSCLLARIIVAERASLTVLTFVQEDMTVRAKILILRYSWPTDRQKSHGCLLDSDAVKRCRYRVGLHPTSYEACRCSSAKGSP